MIFVNSVNSKALLHISLPFLCLISWHIFCLPVSVTQLYILSALVDRSTTNDGMWDVCPFFMNSQQRAGGQAHLETKAIKKKRKWHHYIRSICYAERFKNMLQGKDELYPLPRKRHRLHFHKALIVKVWLQAWFWGMHDPKTFLLKLCFISQAKTKWGLKK